jgi:hypothetical protein
MNAYALPRSPREGQLTQGFISDKTGFDLGELFADDEDVRKYFQRSTLESIFPYETFDQGALDEMSAAVVSNRWHMEPSSSELPPGR